MKPRIFSVRGSEGDVVASGKSDHQPSHKIHLPVLSKWINSLAGTPCSHEASVRLVERPVVNPYPVFARKDLCCREQLTLPREEDSAPPQQDPTPLLVCCLCKLVNS